MVKNNQAIDLNTGELLPAVSPTLFRSIQEEDNFFPIEVDENGNFEINNKGTANTPCVLTIVPKSDVLLFTVKGMSEEPLTFKGVKAGQTLILDGVNREVLLDGKDGIENFDGWEFPKLKPGINKINIDFAYKMFISIKIKPRFI